LKVTLGVSPYKKNAAVKKAALKSNKV